MKTTRTFRRSSRGLESPVGMQETKVTHYLFYSYLLWFFEKYCSVPLLSQPGELSEKKQEHRSSDWRCFTLPKPIMDAFALLNTKSSTKTEKNISLYRLIKVCAHPCTHACTYSIAHVVERSVLFIVMSAVFQSLREHFFNVYSRNLSSVDWPFGVMLVHLWRDCILIYLCVHGPFHFTNMSHRTEQSK